MKRLDITLPLLPLNLAVLR